MKSHFNKYLILESEQRQKRRSLRWVLLGGFIVSILKLYAFTITNSNAILSDVLESVINLAAGLFSLFSLHFAARPRDIIHPYGRGKMEFLSTTVQGSLVFLAGSMIIIKSAYNLLHPQEVGGLEVGTIFIMVSGLANFGLGGYLLRRASNFNSMILRADGRRILADAWSSAALAVGLLVVYMTGILWVDSIIALFCGAFIIRTGSRLVRQSVRGLLDAADSVLLADVGRLMQESSRPAWIEVQDLRASHHGMYMYIDCRMTIPWYWNLLQVNKEVKEAETLINHNFKERVELFVHAEPCQPRHCPMCKVADCPVRQQNVVKSA